MKVKYTYLMLAALSLTVVAQDYNLIIHTKSGETITLATEDIEQMDFEEVGEVGGQLKAPQVSYEKISDNSYTMTWTEVPNAKGYTWKFDGATTSYTGETSYTLKNLSEGTHTFAVKAVAGSGSAFTDSEYTTITFRVTGSMDDMRFLVENFTHNSARVTMLPGTSEYYRVSLLPAASAGSDAQIIQAVKDDSEALMVTEKKEYKFNNLTPATSYIIAAIPGDKSGVVYTHSFTTEATPSAGDTGSIFPPGVSADKGFIDVDKIGDNDYGSDKELCWACAAAGMTQWWINDYKACTGQDYPMAHPLPAESKYYTTPVMDVLMQAYTQQAGDTRGAVKWFFVGNEYPASSYTTNGLPTFQLDYEYVEGGFMGMTQNEYTPFTEYASGVDLFSGKSGNEVKSIFSDKMLGWLRHGPVYVCLSGNHALCAWGADYTVQADGSKLITRLYIAENDLRSGNTINGLQFGNVYFTNYTSGQSNTPYITLATIHDGGSPTSGAIGVFFSLKSWNSVK